MLQTLRSATRSKRNAITLLVVGTLGLFTYQNCQKANFGAESAGSEQFLRVSRLEINGGAEYTNDAGVKLRIEAPAAGEMYITNDPSCEKGGNWETYRSDRSWTLSNLNTKSAVYARFKNARDSQYLGCINASIVHDNIAPKVSILTRPGAIAKAGVANYEYRATDNMSGIESYECRTGTSSWAKCNSLKTYSGLAEGTQETFVRAIDKAGNISDPLPDSFVVDLTAPTLVLTEKPAAFSTNSTAIFRFTADDSGVGVKSVTCTLRLGNQLISTLPNCQSPATLSDLGVSGSVVTYFFSAVAEDKAGNLSASVGYDFQVDRKPSSEFNILGITGPNDSKVDAVLANGLLPTVNWTASEGASTYKVAILNSNGTVKCAEQSVNVPAVQLAMANSCVLTDGATYSANVMAIKEGNISRTAAPLIFKVDASGPVITIAGPTLTNDTKDAKFSFTISDPSGIESATCSRKTVGGAASSTVTTNCTMLTELNYKDLSIGNYTFQITAKDKAGNSSTSNLVTWSVDQVVCDPFSPTADGSCVKGLQANLYYLSEAQRAAPFKNVDEFISKGIKANVLIYLANLFSPTRSFTKGFTTTEGVTLRTNEGETLMEYFALDITTFVKLDPTNETEGKYQFAILSDDGAVVEYQGKNETTWKSLINSDGDHSTRMGCDLVGIDFTTATRTKMRVKYYQGPRTQIALALLWRKMPTKPELVKDVDCDKAHTTYFFGDGNAAQPELVESGYGSLVKRGWKPLAPANFIVNETAKP